MGKRRKKRKTKTIPILPLIGVAVGMKEPVEMALDGDWQSALDKLAWHYTGYSLTTQQFDLEGLKRGLLPIIGGVLVHKALNFLGINRMFSNLPAPLNKLRL